MRNIVPNYVRFDAVRSMAAGSITNTYQTFDVPFGHYMRLLHFINGTDGNMMVSFDGTTDNLPVFAGSFDLYDLTADQDSDESFRYQVGTQVYIKYLTAPTTGTFYLVAVFCKGE